MLIDAHAHLNEKTLSEFVKEVSHAELDLRIISNSIDLETSQQNIDLSRKSDKIIPFVGIHPDVFQRVARVGSLDKARVEKMIEEIQSLTRQAAGLGEIGLDPKYGYIEDQDQLFQAMLSMGERSELPISVHSRGSVSRILQYLSTFSLKGSVLFHWFAGSEQELLQLNDEGMFVSFGPSVLTSKRMRRLVEKTHLDYLLPETDAPTPFSGLTHSITTPYMIASVIFEIGLIKKIGFDALNEIIQDNVLRYLGTQTSLRVK